MVRKASKKKSKKKKKGFVADLVKHPSHYNMGGIEVISFIHAHELDFDRGSAIKYIIRSPFKGTEIRDLRKAIQQLEFRIDDLLSKGVEEIK